MSNYRRIFIRMCISFRFMLNPTGNYIYQLADPDINFDWDTIEQVVKYITARSVCLALIMQSSSFPRQRLSPVPSAYRLLPLLE